MEAPRNEWNSVELHDKKWGKPQRNTGMVMCEQRQLPDCTNATETEGSIIVYAEVLALLW